MKCGKTGSSFGAGAFEATADAAPQIDLVAEIERDLEVIDGEIAEVRHLVGRIALAREAGIKIHVRQQLAASHARRGAGLVNPSHGGFQLLIGLRGPRFQLFQGRIAEDFPPRSFWHTVQRCARFPGAEFF